MAMFRVHVLRSGASAIGGGLGTHYFDESVTTAAAAHADVVSFYAAMATAVCSTSSWTVESEVETVQLDGSVTAVTSVTPVTATGSNAGDELPIATQGLIRWRTGAFLGGRELRGRTFLPGFSVNNSVDGKPSSSLLTVINNAATTFRTGNGLVVFSRTKNALATVTASSAWSEFAVLRSRRD